MTWIIDGDIPVEDAKAGVDADATAGYLGATSSDGVLRTDSSISYTDGGDYITLGVATTGADYQYAESTGTSSTTSGTYQDKVTLTTGALTGTYRLGWEGITSGGSSVRTYVRLRNTTDSTDVTGETVNISQNANARTPACGFGQVTFSGSAKTFKLQWHSFDGETASIREARVELWRVS